MWGRFARRSPLLAPALGSGCVACEVFAFGDNQAGQLGAGGKREMTPAPIALPRVDSLSCGAQCSACVTADGRVYSWGLTKDNRLGHSVGFAEKVTAPTVVPGLADAPCAAVALGDAHGLVLARDGSVFSWGRTTSGEAGRGSQDKTVANLDGFARGARPQCGGGADVGRVPLDIKVESVACGKHHSLVCGEGRVVGWGAASDGQLGPAPQQTRHDALVPVVVEGLPATCAQVSCGSSFSAVRTTDGQVWTWGNNTFGQLGHPGGLEKVALEDVVELACGGSHCVARTAKGEVYTWGLNREGQLGHGHKTPAIPVPQRVEALVGLKVKAQRIAAGQDHTLVVATDGRVFLFGRGRDGQLGLDGLHSTTESRVVPTEAAFFAAKKLKVRAVGLGNGHSLVSCD